MTASSSATALERRQERRVPVHLPLVVRGKDLHGSSFEERTSSENLCRGGAAFATRHPVDLGLQLEIEIPAPPNPSTPRNAPRAARRPVTGPHTARRPVTLKPLKNLSTGGLP